MNDYVALVTIIVCVLMLALLIRINREMGSSSIDPRWPLDERRRENERAQLHNDARRWKLSHWRMIDDRPEE